MGLIIPIPTGTNREVESFHSNRKIIAQKSKSNRKNGNFLKFGENVASQEILFWNKEGKFHCLTLYDKFIKC